MKNLPWKWVYRENPQEGRKLKHPFLMMKPGDVVEYSDIDTDLDREQLSGLCESYNKTYRAAGRHFTFMMTGQTTGQVTREK